MHLESISNGLGAPSLLLLIMAIRKEIPATVSISADTGWENDRIWNTGRRSTNEQYFNEVIVPLCKGSHVTPRFVRTVDENKLELDFYEADRRIKGRFLRMEGEWSIYQTQVTENVRDKATGEKRKVTKDIKWQTHYYPLVDRKMSRADVYKAVEKEGVPYLVSSECDLCPHQDLARWERKNPEVIEDGAWIEALFKGKFFFTPLRIPLKEAIAEMKRKRDANQLEADLDFGCGNAICGV